MAIENGKGFESFLGKPFPLSISIPAHRIVRDKVTGKSDAKHFCALLCQQSPAFIITSIITTYSSCRKRFSEFSFLTFLSIEFIAVRRCMIDSESFVYILHTACWRENASSSTAIFPSVNNSRFANKLRNDQIKHTVFLYIKLKQLTNRNKKDGHRKLNHPNQIEIKPSISRKTFFSN